MNHLDQLTTLRNTYYVLRHGESESNVLDIAVGDPKNGCTAFPLTKHGRMQVRIAAEKSHLPDNTIILHSPFLRTTQTAQIAAETLGTTDLKLCNDLRERFLGDFELKNHAWQHYEAMWEADLQNPDHHEQGVESVHEILDRMTRCVAECEQRYDGCAVLLVSHGDPISILQAAMEGVLPSRHHLDIVFPERGELRALKRLYKTGGNRGTILE